MTIADCIGHAPEELPLGLREELSGQWVALEIYTPQRLPLRKIAAIAATPGDCFAALRARGLDVTHFEVTRLPEAHTTHR